MGSRRYFCVRGFMKSGTNWLGTLLSSHQDISVVGEFHWQTLFNQFKKQFDNLPIYQINDALGPFVMQELQSLFQKGLDQLADPSASLVGDRTPTTIEPLIFEDTPTVSIIRDGRDVLVSRAFHLHNYPDVHRLFKRIPRMGRDHESFKADPWFFKKNPERLLRHELMVRESVRWWKEHLERDQQTIEQHPNAKIEFVKYEDLHADTFQVRKRLFEFLDVDPDKATKIEGVIAPGFANESPNEFLRKGKVGDWKNYFTDEVNQWFVEEAGETLERFGYALEPAEL